MARTPTTLDDLRELLVWGRAHGFRFREVEVEGLCVTVDDVREVPFNMAPQPRTAHEAWAREFGMKLPDDTDPDDDEAQS